MNNLTKLAEMIAALASKSAHKDVKAVTQAMRASYGRTDEEEADALAVAISWRSGFDPLRGADFFTRGARKAHEARESAKQRLSQMRSAFQRAGAECRMRVNAINQLRGGGQRVRPQYINKPI